MQMEIVHSSDSHELSPRESCTLSPHQSPTSLTKGVRHGFSGGRGHILSPSGQIILASNILDLFLLDREVGGEHAVADFSTIGTVTEEGSN